MDESRLAAFLASAETWAADVEVIETHHSMVYLTGEHAYKRKKQRRFAGRDYRSLEARLQSCEREVRVNRRLAPEVYLGVVPVVADEVGRLEVGGRGRPVDYLVHMRRVPLDRTLEAGLREGWAGREHLEAVGRRLATFYTSLQTVPTPPGRRVRELRQKNRAHGAMLRRTGIDGSAVLDPVSEFLRTRGRLVGERGALLVHAHGDLRPEHVVLLEPPIFIDALDIEGEYDDPLDELGYLALECELRGAPWAREPLLGPWRHLTADEAPEVLVDFYQAYRCGLRACLYAIRIAEEGDRHRERARRYLEAGAAHASVLS